MLPVVRPGATSSVLAPSRNALVSSRFLLLVVFDGSQRAIKHTTLFQDGSRYCSPFQAEPAGTCSKVQPWSIASERRQHPTFRLETTSVALVPNSFLFLLVRHLLLLAMHLFLVA